MHTRSPTSPLAIYMGLSIVSAECWTLVSSSSVHWKGTHEKGGKLLDGC